MPINNYFLAVVANELNLKLLGVIFRKLSVLKNHVSRDASGKFADFGRRTGIFTSFRDSVGDINQGPRSIFRIGTASSLVARSSQRAPWARTF